MNKSANSLFHFDHRRIFKSTSLRLSLILLAFHLLGICFSLPISSPPFEDPPNLNRRQVDQSEAASIDEAVNAAVDAAAEAAAAEAAAESESRRDNLLMQDDYAAFQKRFDHFRSGLQLQKVLRFLDDVNDGMEANHDQRLRINRVRKVNFPLNSRGAIHGSQISGKHWKPPTREMLREIKKRWEQLGGQTEAVDEDDEDDEEGMREGRETLEGSLMVANPLPPPRQRLVTLSQLRRALDAGSDASDSTRQGRGSDASDSTRQGRGSASRPDAIIEDNPRPHSVRALKREDVRSLLGISLANDEGEVKNPFKYGR